MTVHLISVEQASYLDVALRTRQPHEPMPACPTCREEPSSVWHRRERLTPAQLGFEPCGHVHELDPSTWDDWTASAPTNPWVEIFEDHCRELQRKWRAAGEA